MVFFSTNQICCFLLLFALAAAKDLIVDASLPSASDPTYPSLSEAINALLTGNNLTEATNTITLLDSCLAVPQHFIGAKIGPAGANGGSISIVYSGAMPSTINNEDTCSQLPNLVLAGGSYMNLEYLTTFSISGVNIIYNGATKLNSLFNVQTVNFSNLCFNNSEPTNEPFSPST